MNLIKQRSTAELLQRKQDIETIDIPELALIDQELGEPE